MPGGFPSVLRRYAWAATYTGGSGSPWRSIGVLYTGTTPGCYQKSFPALSFSTVFTFHTDLVYIRLAHRPFLHCTSSVSLNRFRKGFHGNSGRSVRSGHGIDIGLVFCGLFFRPRTHQAHSFTTAMANIPYWWSVVQPPHLHFCVLTLVVIWQRELRSERADSGNLPFEAVIFYTRLQHTTLPLLP